MEEDVTLIPIRITQGWAVIYNRFYDVLPVVDEYGTIQNWSFFTSRLLNIHVLDMKTSKVDYEQTLFIDVEWNKEGDPEGDYYAALIYQNQPKDIRWQEVKNFRSKDRFMIAETIATWMKDIDIIAPFKRL